MTEPSNLEPHFDEKEVRTAAMYHQQYAKTMRHYMPNNPYFAEQHEKRAAALLRAIEAYDALRERCLAAELKLKERVQ